MKKRIEQMPGALLKIMGGIASRLPKTILGLRYYRWTGKRISWKHPANLQEFVLANMINARKDRQTITTYADLADKVKAKEYVTDRVGGEIVPKLYGVWNSAEEIDWDSLPSKFAIKTNNGCGTNIIVRDKSKIDTAETARTLDKWLKIPYGQLTGQAHYTLIKPCILAEEMLEDKHNPGKLPQDYKVFCFNGVPKFILYYEDRKVNGHVTPNMAYDTQWHPIKDIILRPVDHEVPAPKSLDAMIDAAAKLSKGLPFARVDFYDLDGKLYFGEVTLTPDVRLYFTPDFLTEAMNYLG